MVSLSRAWCGGLGKTNARLFSICELDACSFKSTLNCLNGPLFQLIAPLEPGDRVNRDFCRPSKLSNTEVEGRSRHSTLHRDKNHYVVPILVDSTDFASKKDNVPISVPCTA